MEEENLDLMLVNPSTNEEVYESLSKEAALEPPFLAALTAGFIRDHGFKVALLDANVEGLTQEKTAEIIKKNNPRLIAIIAHGHQPSASSQLMGAIGKLCKEIKKITNTPIFLAGIHPSSLPERTLREESCDFVARGEMYYTILNLLEYLDTKNFEKVPGLCYLDKDGKFIANKAAPLIENLDKELSNVAWDLLPGFDKYRAHNWHVFGENLNRSPYGALYTSLGCPFRCSFCCINAEFKASIADNKNPDSNKGSDDDRLKSIDAAIPRIRYWSPDTIIKHLDYMASQNVKNVKIIDEMFVLNKYHVKGICDKIIERGYKFNIWVYARIDTVKDIELLKKMKQAGINWLALGIESANVEVRHGADKKFSNDDIIKNVRQVQEVGINIIGNYMVGLRNDTPETIKQTFEMAKKLKTEWFNIYATMVYPGAPDYSWARSRGMKIPGDPGIPGGWTAYSHHSWYTLPLDGEYITASEALKARDDFYQGMVSDPEYLQFLKDKFGEKVADYVRSKIGKRINRRILTDPIQTNQNNPIQETVKLRVSSVN
mgnify:CR=1 FL=1